MLQRFAIALGLVFAFPLAAVADTATATTVRIEIEPSVSERLLAMGEWITVAVTYFGQPSETAIASGVVGEVDLGAETATIYPVNQTVVLGGSLTASPMDMVTQPWININVVTAGYAEPLNLIQCDVITGMISDLKAEENVIFCKWLGE